MMIDRVKREHVVRIASNLDGKCRIYIFGFQLELCLGLYNRRVYKQALGDCEKQTHLDARCLQVLV